MGRGVGSLLTRDYILGNEVYENRNGILSLRVKDSPLGKEFDTYKVGTVANSTSTMHKITSKPITLDCFEIDDYNEGVPLYERTLNRDVNRVIVMLEELRQRYLEFITKAKEAEHKEEKDYYELLAKNYWKELIRWLPSSWLQTRTWTANYEVLRTMYHQRKDHKLSEWRQFCDWCKILPYAKEFIID